MAVNQIKLWDFPPKTQHAALLLFLILPATVIGQPASDPNDQYPYAKFSPSMAIIIAVLVTALFFMGFFSIYIRRWSQSGPNGTAMLSMRSRRAAVARGLDASVIETFPTLAYSEVKDLHMGKGALECAVCLNEFEDDETLRLLPKCDHVFHPECIDLWLASHTTCPVCRADLVPVPGELPVSQPGNEGENVVDDNVQPQGEVHVTIPEENQELATNISVEPSKPEVINRAGSLRVNRPPRSGSVRSGSVRSKLLNFGNKFPRSHSTGHSLVQPGENVDRYTLRLPEEVRKDIIKKALNRTGSCVSGEGSVKKRSQHGNEEGSSRGKRSYKRLESLERIGKSDRWSFVRMPSFLTRAMSTRSPKVMAGEGEASTSKEPAKVSGNDTTGNNEKAGREGNDPAKLPV